MFETVENAAGTPSPKPNLETEHLTMQIGEMSQALTKSLLHDSLLDLGRRVDCVSVGDEVAEQSAVLTDRGFEGHRGRNRQGLLDVGQGSP